MTAAATEPEPPAEILLADRLLTGRPGEQLCDAALLVVDDSIAAVGDRRTVTALAPAARQTRYPDATLLPGLIDAHAHLTLRHGEDFTAPPGPSTARERAATAARNLLAAGVTTVRDLGSAGSVMTEVRDAVWAGRLPGPRLIVSGPPVTVPGGHMASIGVTVEYPRSAAEAVRRLASQRVDVIKIIATGGALTPGTPLGQAQLDPATARAVVATSHHLGLPVAAHAHGATGITQAAAAGVDTIEHCSWLGPDGKTGPIIPAVAGDMRQRKIVAVLAGPLTLQGPATAAWQQALTPAARRQLGRWAAARQLAAAGVTLAVGTDSFFGQFPGYQDLAYHAEALVHGAGWPAPDVIAMVTAGGAAALGAAGRRIGRLAPGYRADVLVADGDLVQDITGLRRVRDVLISGRRPGVPPGPAAAGPADRVAQAGRAASATSIRTGTTRR